jgi:hypothetical protein
MPCYVCFLAAQMQKSHVYALSTAAAAASQALEQQLPGLLQHVRQLCDMVACCDDPAFVCGCLAQSLH